MVKRVESYECENGGKKMKVRKGERNHNGDLNRFDKVRICWGSGGRD